MTISFARDKGEMQMPERSSSLPKCFSRRQKPWRQLSWYPPFKQRRVRRIRIFLCFLLVSEAIVLFRTKSVLISELSHNFITIERESGVIRLSEPPSDQKEHGITIDIPQGRIRLWESIELHEP